MRSHPVVGSLFLLLGATFFLLGATASTAPGPLGTLPVPPEIVMPFIFWQLAVWAILFGIFFVRPRGRSRRPTRARVPARS